MAFGVPGMGEGNATAAGMSCRRFFTSPRLRADQRFYVAAESLLTLVPERLLHPSQVFFASRLDRDGNEFRQRVGM